MKPSRKYKSVLAIVSFFVITACGNKGQNQEMPNQAVIPAHKYAIVNPVANVSTIYWNEKVEYNDSLSYRAAMMMIDSFKKSKILENSAVYWSSSQDYAVASNSLWNNVYFGNSMSVPNAFLNELTGLNERYVLLIRYTGYVRHWTNITTRALLRFVNEFSFGLFGLDEDDMIIESMPDVNMKVLALDRESKRVVYKGNLDLSLKHPMDSTTINLFTKYYFGE